MFVVGSLGNEQKFVPESIIKKNAHRGELLYPSNAQLVQCVSARNAHDNSHRERARAREYSRESLETKPRNDAYVLISSFNGIPPYFTDATRLHTESSKSLSQKSQVMWAGKKKKNSNRDATGSRVFARRWFSFSFFFCRAAWRIIKHTVIPSELLIRRRRIGLQQSTQRERERSCTYAYQRPSLFLAT